MNKPLTGVTRRKLRSSEWFNNPHNPGMTALYLERYLNYGLTRHELQSGKPIIGIAQTGSDLSPCNRHHLELAHRVREGIRAAGEIDYEEFMTIVASSAPSVGHCNTMGTASTMNSLAEALGMSLPGCAAIPAPHRERGQIAYRTGQRIVEMVWEDLKPSDILTREAFENTIVANSAIGGSTNAPIHINAIARHIGVKLSIQDWETIGHKVPLLVNMQPAGKYLGEEYHRAGGVPAVVNELMKRKLIHEKALTVNGKTMGENCAKIHSDDPDVITPIDKPLKEDAGFVVLSGNLFNDAIMKTSVIDQEFRARFLSNPKDPDALEGRAIVFEGPEDYHR